MSIHKLTAGSGYDYLTRQVATLDATEKGHVGLASYYTERGETPGVWIGSGMAGIDGLNAGDVVTAEQMQALFGSGLHPLAAQRVNDLAGPDLTEGDYQAIIRLGAPFKVYPNDISPFRLEVAKRIAAINTADGLPGDWPVPPSDRSRIRSEVGRETFRAEHGRDPSDARELAGAIARYSRPQTRAVAGFDLTFSPVKSVSALWAVAKPSVAAHIERAHQAAISDALRFIETQALFTRTGTNGVRQVDVQGLVATAFTHRDSRAGDPDLHTHVAVANKVQTLDGQWLSVDGRILFKATVAASETYNTALERHLTDTLGVRFVERPNPDPRLRPVREIGGIDPRLNERWSARRAAIDTRRHELAANFQAAHGRPPTPVEMLQLAQQANLETRHAKHEPRALTEQRATWQAEAEQVLGGPAAVQAMVRTALTPTAVDLAGTDAGQVDEVVGRVLTVMESSRSTWQMWHVRAEAHRQIRTLHPATGHIGPLVELITSQVLHDRSVSLARPFDGVNEPPLLRRTDGASVYTVAGADLYTSTKILAAERRLVATAGRTDGHTINRSFVDLALLEATANQMTLNPGQAALVRDMCASGARLQLAIAPAGAGKTTALQALTNAWTAGAGTVIGLAPSASAAAQLRDQTGARTDTLAKLTWSIDHDHLPEWARNIGPSTLVVIDEAGMADTLSLDTAVKFVTSRGGSVRLVGDDQQLAAIGAGGVLRDIQATHGAVRLTELLRFTDPAEAAATLALRDGGPEALGFYLDHERVIVGDLAGLSEEVFSAWQTDRNQGLDSIMLAPTRDLAAQLNHRARTHRLDQPTPARRHGRDLQVGREVVLADSNRASAGDTVITRSNNRKLQVSRSDWVKNGDRWTIQAVGRDGSLKVMHNRHGRSVRLPSDYVQTAVELGYATTVHTAQGVSVDTMHGLASGVETRQQLYTMMTRGRTTNHLYLQVVGDGDPHSVIRPELIHPWTATDVLEQILANDQTAQSATTLKREQHDPTVRLGDAAPRYLDALYVAAEDVVGPEILAALGHFAEQIVPGLTNDAAWPTLRAHLILLAAHGADPVARLAGVAGSRELNTADDKAAILDWRLDDTGLRNAGPGPLPWIPGIPTSLQTHPTWGPYLTGRADLVTQLAGQIRNQIQASTDRPNWAGHGAPATAPTGVVAEVEVWRAATQVQAGDQRPTGPAQLQKTARAWQEHLDHALTAGQQPALTLWGPLIRTASPSVTTDSFLPVLADRLAALDRAGIDARPALYTAITAGPLPDDHAAAALWWRITRHLPFTVVAQLNNGKLIPTGRSGSNSATPTNDPWRIFEPGTDQDRSITGEDDTTRQPPAGATDLSVHDDRWLEPDLAVAALVREAAGPRAPSDADTTRQWERVLAWQESPVSRERMLEINQLTLDFYRGQYPGSWGQVYLTQRFGEDLIADDRFRPGQAPAGWTNLVTHLHRHGVTDQEMTTAGVATTASTGRLIDRFRDRVILPIIDNRQILGFVGRRHPDHGDADRHGPKYLNTPDTPLFHKGAQLYGAHLTARSGKPTTPVIVEGPMDAIAVTLAGRGRYIGVAQLGTSLTDEQAAQLARIGVDPIVATDGDLAGQVAAERDYWILTPHRLDPSHAKLPASSDPAVFLTRHGHRALNALLAQARPLADTLLEERLTNLPADQAVNEATRVVAARPAEHWNPGSETISARLHLPHGQVRRGLLAQVKAWNVDPRAVARLEVQNVHAVKTRLVAAENASPDRRWAGLANQLDPRLTSQSDWPALANLIQQAHDAGLDVAATTRQLINDTPLNALPAQDLRYRLVGRLSLNPYPTVSADTATPPNRARPNEDRRNQSRSPNTSPDMSR